MAWKRGTGSVEVELSNVQSWIEGVDPSLNGQNGDPGLIRLFHEERAARVQKEKDHEQFINRRVQYITMAGGLVALLKILELVHIIPR